MVGPQSARPVRVSHQPRLRAQERWRRSIRHRSRTVARSPA
nr:MAG TPA: hypothetical protein [Caudoviricetes sp.]DAJ53720.1 MAG TPA: hypothetical protein [Caudoviricetes sp.]DAZ42865.1 MAG TPA: hypothetical protein [Caudoviricetes sp.]